MKTLPPLLLLLTLALCEVAAARGVPLPRPRPPQAPNADESPAASAPAPPSECRLRLTDDWAIAPSIEPVIGPGECGIADPVRLEAVVLADGTPVAVTPPAVIRCSLAEALAHWVREDIVPAVRSLHTALTGIDNFEAYDCRGRNRIVGAMLSEHGKGNALDIRSLKLAGAGMLDLTDPHVSKAFRERLREATCARFETVLGPGSDGYHESHVHVDLAERHGSQRYCHWEVREPVPLPRPRPAALIGQSSED